ncbi:MAG: response regulator receiver modulated serine phosphatase [Xanthobacteraceae bacterium]|jgi:sigma-B regulation protein RsbU (phosphoserine phosphatase)|nr:response regulator receiver modulated serine phosphatase [Xanthobacteraceae bacterium]
MALPSARVLIVDDIAENRELLVRRLKRLWIDDIDEAVNGVEALAAIGRKNYDIVLLDIMMPEMDGFGVLEQLKADGRINDLPVVVISAMNEIDPMVRCIELGAEDFIFKPFNPTLLRARVMATLEKKALRDQTREELRRKQYELNEARTLQLALVPPAFRGNCGGFSLSIDVVLEPAKEVGGDLVDHFRVGDLVVLALGDVSDKGAGAALMMARTHSMFRGLSMRPDADALFRDPAAAVGLVNAALAKANESCMFVTFLLATFDPANGEFRYVRAGHVPPFVRRENGKIERPSHQGGLPLGLVEDGVYTSDAVLLAPGDRVLVLTDGFTEAADPADNLFGETMIESFLAELTEDTAAPLDLLTAQVKAFEAGLPAADDMAAFLLTLFSFPHGPAAAP